MKKVKIKKEAKIKQTKIKKKTKKQDEDKKSKRKSRKSRKSMVQIDRSKKTGWKRPVKIDGSKWMGQNR